MCAPIRKHTVYYPNWFLGAFSFDTQKNGKTKGKLVKTRAFAIRKRTGLVI